MKERVMKSGWAAVLIVCCGCSGASGAEVGAESFGDAGRETTATRPESDAGSSTDAGHRVEVDAGMTVADDAGVDDASSPDLTDAGVPDAAPAMKPVQCRDDLGNVYSACNGYGPDAGFDVMVFRANGQPAGVQCSADMPQTNVYCPTGSWCDWSTYDSHTQASTNHYGTCVN